jgi:D-alanyl-D-alanine dipeptidase
LIDVSQIEASIRLDMRYAGVDNFVGEPIEGYLTARCLLSEPAAKALARVQRGLSSSGLGLLVFDCYRPQRAVDHFVRWAADLSDIRTKSKYYPTIVKSQLFELGYIAAKSGHSRGSTVDVTLVRKSEDGRWVPLAMGTEYDFFDSASHIESSSISESEQENRLLLKEAMEGAGFENYPEEWWHYTLREEPYPNSHWDVPIR